ncbi:hypothetical protein WJ971_15760 [Achromobacter xylosoxidans]
MNGGQATRTSSTVDTPQPASVASASAAISHLGAALGCPDSHLVIMRIAQPPPWRRTIPKRQGRVAKDPARENNRRIATALPAMTPFKENSAPGTWKSC